MYKILGLHFFRTTKGIQSGSDAFYKSRLVMTWTNLGVTEILWSSKFVLKGKASKEILESKFKFLEKFFASRFPLSEAEGSTSSPLNRGV